METKRLHLLYHTVIVAGSRSTSLTIRVHNVSNTPSFDTTGYNISNRATTSASVGSSSISVWDRTGQTHQTPNISTIVQEIIDRDDWIAYNAMAFIIVGPGKPRTMLMG